MSPLLSLVEHTTDNRAVRCSNHRGLTIFSNDLEDKSVNTLDQTENHTYKTAIFFNNTDEFFEYVSLKEYCKDHLKTIKTYFKKHFSNKRFNTPMELLKYIQTKEKAKRQIIKTARYT